MKLKIDIKNKEKIEKVLNEANGKCTTRTVSATVVIGDASYAERHLDFNRVPQAARKGCRYEWCETVNCNSYVHRATATLTLIERGSKDWFLIKAERVQTATGRGTRSDHFYPTTKAIEACLAQVKIRLERI